MKPTKLGILLFAVSCSAAYGQTPPVQPKVQESTTPPAVLLPGPSAIPEGLDKPLTATEAAKVALHYQQSLVISASTLLSARGRKEEANSALYPSIGLNGSYSRSENLRVPPGGDGGAGNPGFNASVSLKQLIFDFNRTRDLARQASASAEAAESQYTGAQNDLVLQTKQAFYNLAQNRQLVAVAEANVKNNEYQLALAKARVNVGLGEPSDMVSAEGNLSGAQQSLVSARAAAVSSQIALALLMGIDPRTPITLATEREPAGAEDDLSALIGTAMKQRPDVQAARLSVDAARLGLSAALKLNAPALELGVSANGSGRTDPTASSTGAASLGLTWTLFDSGFQGGKIKEAKAALQTSLASQTIVQQTAISDVSQAYIALKSALQRKQITSAQVVNATEGVRISQGRYQAGVGTFVDVTTAQALLVSAETNDVNADAAIDQARASLAHALGQSLQ